MLGENTFSVIISSVIFWSTKFLLVKADLLFWKNILLGLEINGNLKASDITSLIILLTTILFQRDFEEDDFSVEQTTNFDLTLNFSLAFVNGSTFLLQCPVFHSRSIAGSVVETDWPVWWVLLLWGEARPLRKKWTTGTKIMTCINSM